MFKINELLKATCGRLLCGDSDTAVKGISIDSRTIKPGEAFIALKGSNFDGHNFIAAAIKKGAGAIIAGSSGHPVIRRAGKIPLIEVKDTIIALGDIARFKREEFTLPVIAVTGSNGKTTTKEMIAWVLSKRFKVLKNIGTKNNQIGLPLTLSGLNASYDFAVLELGTNHFGEIDYLAKITQPNIAIITNIGPSHLKYFRDLRGVFREKYSLLRHLEVPHIAMLNADDRLLKKYTSKNNNRNTIFGFGIKNKSDFFASAIRILNGRIEFLVNQKYRVTLKASGYFNIYNALVAIAVGRIFSMEYRDIAERLFNFEFPQDRLQHLRLNKIKFINDTYNSNPSSLKQALDVLDELKVKGRKIFVMGDMLELGSLEEFFHRQAGKEIAHICDCLVTVGRRAKLVACQAKESGLSAENIFTCASSVRARDILFTEISVNPDDIVLVKGSRAMKMEEILKAR